MHKQLTVTFWRDAYFALAREVDQVLGKALGYPYYCSDQKNFPGTVPADGVCTGDHVSESLIAEAANKLTQKPLAIKESDNTPCTAHLEVELEKLATYFDRRARENAKRATKLEEKLKTFTDLIEIVKAERGAYYFSGKEDSYKNAAFKIRALLVKDKAVLTHPSTASSPSWVVKVYEAAKIPDSFWTWKHSTKTDDAWVVECKSSYHNDFWSRSVHFLNTFPSEKEAQKALKQSGRLQSTWYTYRVAKENA